MALTLVALLYIHPGHETEFEQFESAAARIMRRYGGALERRIGRTAEAASDQPHEVHVVTFPDQRSFANYRADEELRALADLRARAIRNTLIVQGVELTPWSDTG